jgi:hypothetical protein
MNVFGAVGGGSGFAVVGSLWAEGDTTDILWET